MWCIPDELDEEYLERISRRYPTAKNIHLIQDNLNIHRLKSLIDFYGNDIGMNIWKRFKVHYTPKHGSRLNQAEIEIGIYSKQCPGRQRLGSILTLTKEINQEYDLRGDGNSAL